MVWTGNFPRYGVKIKYLLFNKSPKPCGGSGDSFHTSLIFSWSSFFDWDSDLFYPFLAAHKLFHRKVTQFDVSDVAYWFRIKRRVSLYFRFFWDQMASNVSEGFKGGWGRRSKILMLGSTLVLISETATIKTLILVNWLSDVCMDFVRKQTVTSWKCKHLKSSKRALHPEKRLQWWMNLPPGLHETLKRH